MSNELVSVTSLFLFFMAPFGYDVASFPFFWQMRRTFGGSTLFSFSFIDLLEVFSFSLWEVVLVV